MKRLAPHFSTADEAENCGFLSVSCSAIVSNATNFSQEMAEVEC